jgi:hypothetical protein
MGDEQTFIDAADLAERILDEVSSSEPNWPSVEHLADALAALAAAFSAPSSPRCPEPG